MNTLRFKFLHFFFKKGFSKSQANEFTFYEALMLYWQDMRDELEDRKYKMQLATIPVVVMSEEGAKEYSEMLKRIDNLLLSPQEKEARRRAEEEKLASMFIGGS